MDGRRRIAGLMSACALVFLFRLIVPATAGVTDEPAGVRRQLRFLRRALDGGAGEEAQRLFPEGYFFLHVLYGLSWIELGMREPIGDRAPALREARWALERVDSPAGRAPFSPDLDPPRGVFYRGWSNWLRGGVLSLQPVGQRNPVEQQRFADDSAALAAAFDASSSPFLPSYPGQSWPCDSTVAVASLRLHDAILPPRFGGTVGRWLREAKQRLDPLTGLLAHRADTVTGSPLEVARATSQSVIGRFLVDIDPEFARQQYLRFRQKYVVSRFGFGPVVREYPDGLDGQPDVDSGPLLFGVTFSATAVTIGAAQVNGDGTLAGALASFAEMAGVPIDTPQTKRYAFGLLPIGDAFLAWSKTARPWVSPMPTTPTPLVPWWWRLPLSSLLGAVAAAPWVVAWLRRRARSSRGPMSGGASRSAPAGPVSAS